MLRHLLTCGLLVGSVLFTVTNGPEILSAAAAVPSGCLIGALGSAALGPSAGVDTAPACLAPAPPPPAGHNHSPDAWSIHDGADDATDAPNPALAVAIAGLIALLTVFGAQAKTRAHTGRATKLGRSVSS
jgi:hypothetical protein